jgi:hypothetical protein
MKISDVFNPPEISPRKKHVEIPITTHKRVEREMRNGISATPSHTLLRILKYFLPAIADQSQAPIEKENEVVKEGKEKERKE